MSKLEYVWLDVNNELRSKTKYVKKVDVNNLPIWNFDGSSTGQAEGSHSEVLLKPCRYWKDPFRRQSLSGNKHYLVLCETYNMDNTPHVSNTRHIANIIFNQFKEQEPMYGLEQEFFLFKEGKPLHLYLNHSELPGKYYCGIGEVVGRDIIEDALDNCLYAGLNITGINAEVAPSQWEMQVCATGINACDELIILRYILARTAEESGIQINLDPKPLNGEHNGSGCHTNFSTLAMREDEGYDEIVKAINLLADHHEVHMKNYGVGNDRRMTGTHETSSFDKFSWGVADRGSSIRVPKETVEKRKGYFEDRRPASNMDPYVVCSLILQTVNK